jgi:hypothetical protein
MKNLKDLIINLPDSQRPLFPGETWYLDENNLREQKKRYEELIFNLSNTGLTIPQTEEEIGKIVSMDITVTEYSEKNLDSFLEGIKLFAPVS